MIYLVTNQIQLFGSDRYKTISVGESIEILSPLKVVGVDSETLGFDVYTKALLSVQLGDFNNQVVIDCTTVDIKQYKEFLESDRLFLFWNAKFDLKFLYHQRIVPKNVYDGFLAEKLMWMGYPSGSHKMSLEAAAMEYMNVQLDKSIRGKIIYKGLCDETIVYAADDVKYLEFIKDKQEILLEEKDLLTALFIENNFVKTLAYIEYSGIKLDIPKWQEKMKNDNKLLFESELKLNAWVKEKMPNSRYCTINLQGDLFSGFNPEPICNINWNSSKQVIPFLEELGFNLLVKDKKTGFMKKSVEGKVIELQKDKSDVTPVYLEYKGAQKVVSTYGQNFIDAINPVTGRIHTQYNQLMDTGRMSCGGKNKDTGEEYLNLQNLPSDEETRHAFIAEDGNLLIDCDFHAQEDFIFTELSQEPKLIEFYNDKTRDRDGHSFVAKICFPEQLKDIAEEDVKKLFPDLRAMGKKGKFSIHYGGNGTTIARNLSISIERGIAIEKAYLKGLPNINTYFKRVKKEMWTRGYILISSITGHKMFIPGWEDMIEEERTHDSNFWAYYREQKVNDPDCLLVQRVRNFFKKKSGFERNSLNCPVQGSAAIITKIAGIKFFNWLVKNNLLFIVWIPNCVHDEYLVESPEQLSDMVAENLQKCMEDAGEIFCKSVKLTAVPEIAKMWVH